VASSWGPALRLRILGCLLLTALFAPRRFETSEAIASRAAPLLPAEPIDPGSMSKEVVQESRFRIFDTSSVEGDASYVNDHTFVQARDGSWHLFGIFHREPATGGDDELDFIHAVTNERDPAKWATGEFQPAPAPYTIALHVDRKIGETHLWAPHVVAADGRYWMFYQGGGSKDDRASMRVAESDDLYRWTRVSDVPLFEDFCVARDPMLVRREAIWTMHYTRCDTMTKRASGVAYRQSRDLVHWSEPHMLLTLGDQPSTTNSAFTESPFVFEHGGYYYLSVTSYPVEWDATFLFRSPAPYAFPSVPLSRLRAHAAEWIVDHGRAWMTHAGSGQRGVWMAPVSGL
jgi:hypothetical protein